jgi:hypothetical protein
MSSKSSFLAGLAAALVLAGGIQAFGGKPTKPPALVNPAFVVMDGSSIELLSSDAQSAQTLTSGGNVDRSTPVWSPDGNWIAYVLRDRSGTQIRLMDKDGRNPRIVMAFSKGSPTLPHWYSRLQWVPGEVDRLLMRNIDGRLSTVSIVDGTWETVLEAGPEGTWFDGFSPQLSPDMSTESGYQGAIAYGWLNYDDTSGNILDLRVSLVTEGEFGIEVDTTSTDLLPIPYRQDGFRWSPDGTRIAYVDEASDMSQNLLQIVEVAVHREPMPPSIDILENTIWTRDHTNQSYELLEALAWSPDGEWLAYDKQTGGAPGGGKLMDLFIVRSDGTGLPINITNNSSSITSEGRYSSPDWNPLWVKNIDNP